MDEQRMRERLGAARVARLATIGPAGGPAIVPFCFVLDGDRLYSAVDHKPKRTRRLQRLANAAREPRVSVLVDHYEEDWNRLWWVRVDGRAAIVDDPGEVEHAVGLLAAKYAQYRTWPPLGPVSRIDIERLRGWAAA
jgi:PPOX class probable F420-dependent enzyme